MTTAKTRLGMVAFWVLGCGSQGAIPGDGGRDAPPAKDTADAGGSDVKGPPGSDAPSAPEAPLCPIEADNGALVPSAPACSVATMMVDAATLCPGAARCPVTSMVSLTCAGGGYGPWVTPAGAGAAMMFVTASGRFVTRLVTLAPGAAPRVDDVPGLTSAANALSADEAGNPIIFAGEMPGIWRVRKTAAGWRRELAFAGAEKSLVNDGRALDATKAFVAYYNLSDNAPRLATRDGDCWHDSLLPGRRLTFMGLDVDGMGRAWVAWFDYTTAGMPTLSLAGPGGPHSVWTSTVSEGLALRDHPIVLAGGLTGAAAFPALGIQRADGIHLLVADAATPSWADRLVAGSAIVARTGNCPPQTFGMSCGALTTCTMKSKGAVSSFGLARTTSGHSYAVWIDVDGETTYTLSSTGTPGVFCPSAVPPPPPPASDGGAGVAAPMAPICSCNQIPMSSKGTAAIVVQRVDGASPAAPLRLQLDTAGELVGGMLDVRSRGDALLIGASIGSAQSRVQYLEVDTTQLP